MPAAFNNISFIKNKNFVGIDDRRQTMRDDERRSSLGNALECRLNLPLGKTVKR